MSADFDAFWTRVEGRLEDRGVLPKRRRIPWKGVAVVAMAASLALVLLPRSEGELTPRGGPAPANSVFGVRAFVVDATGAVTEARPGEALTRRSEDRAIFMAANHGQVPVFVTIACLSDSGVAWTPGETRLEALSSDIAIESGLREVAPGTSVVMHFLFTKEPVSSGDRDRLTASLRAGTPLSNVTAQVTRRIKGG